MARSRGSISAAIDPLFEFDAPQTFKDLSAPLSLLPAGEHDVWFDQIHAEHSKPSAELADALHKLQDKEKQFQDAVKLKSNIRRDHGWVSGKENEQPADWREIVATRNKQLKEVKRNKYMSFKEIRATQEPFKVHKTKREVKAVAAGSHKKSRRPLMDAGSRLNSGRKRTLPSAENKDMKDLHDLLQKHNKKFKAAHTYEPSQHSVREVKQWERATSKSYYALSTEERVQANQEITIWKQRRQVERSH